jgi:hypothetical protein
VRFVDAKAGSCQVIVEWRGPSGPAGARRAPRPVRDGGAHPAGALAGEERATSRVRATAALGAARSGVEAALAMSADRSLDPHLWEEILDVAAAAARPPR